MRLFVRWVLIFLAIFVLGSRADAQSASLDFNADIEPILADHCYQCHGPDPGGRKANLRLDHARTAFARLNDGKAPIVPGHPEQSEVIRRVTSTDLEVHMPPEGHDALKPNQIEVLRQWIFQGAKYRDHWAFEQPVRPPLPDVSQAEWVRNPIDRFILAGLKKNGLSPSPPATKQALIRRVTLDLTGLLPTHAELDAFVNDRSPEAYEKLVDRLLASPRFGEHRAHYWLDYVRYGDTHGLHNDNYRDIWPYRDYVIRAFNQNKPYDQFAMEQIAGDLLPPTNVDQIVATGFVRCNLSTGEGGTINEEIRVNNNRDRVECYGTVFMGMTLGCAVCHDHKFDPVTQKDFYQLTAYFNNLNERESNDDRFDVPATIRVPKPQHLAEYNEVLARKASVVRQLDSRQKQIQSLLVDWLDFGDRPKAVSTHDLDLRFRFDEQNGDLAINSAPHAEPKSVKFIGTSPVWGEETWLWPSLRFEAATKLELPIAGDFEKDQPFSAGGWFQIRFNPTAIGDVNIGSLMSRMQTSSGLRGWDLWYDNGSLTVHLVHDWPKNVIRVQTKTKPVAKGEWHHVLFTYDGSGKAAGVKIFVDGKSQPVKIVADALTDSIRTTAPWELGRRHGASAMKLARFQDIRLYSRQLSWEEVSRLPYEDYVAQLVNRPQESWNDDERHAVSQFYLRNVDEPSVRLSAQIRVVDNKLDALSADGQPTMICQERPQLAYAHVLARGIYTARTQRVRADLPQFLPNDPGLPRNRLGLARWTVSPQNPLTARVAVNRMWLEIFGIGLVDTPGDFGMMGSRPSNPQLLDWLAFELRESGWNMKHMYRLMVTSAAYRQSARITPDLLEKDPQNRLLARGPRFRMDAEMLRDCALESSGLLVEKLGGPSAKPYQPPGIWEAVRGLATKPQTWEQDHGEGTYRRSLYTFWKRQAPAPDMIALDAPPRDVSCPRRERTNTPLQALVLWNDPQWFEAARMLAQRTLEQCSASDEDRLNFIAESVVCRRLSKSEQRIFLSSLKTFESRFTRKPAAAIDLLKTGDTKPDPSLPPVDLAAWTMVASEVLNTDEALNK
jgi:hypothetical protein